MHYLDEKAKKKVDESHSNQQEPKWDGIGRLQLQHNPIHFSTAIIIKRIKARILTFRER